MIPRVIAVAWREFLATVRTKAFILTMFMMPTIMVIALFGTRFVQRLAEGERLPVRRVAVVDHTGSVYAELVRQFEAYNAEYPNQIFELELLPAETARTESLIERAQRGTLYGYVILRAGALDIAGDVARVPAHAGEPDAPSPESRPAPVVLARTDSQLQLGQRLERMINNAIYAVRFQQAGIDVAEVTRLRTPVSFELLDAKTGAPVTSDVMARALTPFVFMFLLFMGTFGISQGLLTTVIEEKSSRVIEVLLSAVSPTELMAGKILGTVLVGFLLIVVWGGFGFWGAQSQDLGDLVTGYRVTIAVLYFIPGFLFIASLLAGIGSACNELKEAQSMAFPLSIITVVPMFFWFYIAEYPSSLLSVALSYVPPITPFVMMLRICANPDTPLWQIVSTLAVLWVSVLVAIWAAGKVFRVGILMYGKPPSLKDLFRWVRAA